MKPAVIALTESANILFNKLDEPVDALDDCISNETYEQIQNIEITKTDILNALNTLKNKTPGISTIPMSYYKSAGDVYYENLAQFYTLILKYDYIPETMKIDTKIAIPKWKKGDSELTKIDANNYRNLGLQNGDYLF